MPDTTQSPTQPNMSPSLLVSTPATGTLYTNGFTKQPPHAQLNGFAAKHVDPTYPVKRTTTLKHEAFAFDAIEDALAAFARGEFLVVMDDESRENEGDLIIAAEHVTTEKMAWMIKHTRCV